MEYQKHKTLHRQWIGNSKGYKLSDPDAYTFMEECSKLGITNLHVHKGPTVYPLNRDAFDVHDVDDAATHFPELTFIIEHVGLPRLEDFCWIATQESNVLGGLSVAMPFMHPCPRYCEIMANLLLPLVLTKFSSAATDMGAEWLIEFWALSCLMI
jgi:predicted TIM-barrel fold metal-dependent hydrolase